MVSRAHKRKLLVSRVGTLLMITGFVGAVFLSVYAYLSGDITTYTPYVIISILYGLAGLKYRGVGAR